MTHSERIAAVYAAISNKKDLSFIEQLEKLESFQNRTELVNFISILLVLVEESDWWESALTLLFKKVYQQNWDLPLMENEVGRLFLETICNNAVSPYLNISTGLRRLITTLIYARDYSEVHNILKLTSQWQLLNTNEFLFKKFLGTKVMSQATLSLYYNCVEDIEPQTTTIIISEVANNAMKAFLDDELMFRSYLRLFIRPMYISSSANFPGKDNYVPEPFYKQIFGSIEGFKMRLDRSKIVKPQDRLLTDIDRFITLYLNGNRNFVKVPSDIKLEKTLHIGLS